MSTCYNPKTMDELGQALSQLTGRSLILAGGTDLVLRLRSPTLCCPSATYQNSGELRSPRSGPPSGRCPPWPE